MTLNTEWLWTPFDNKVDGGLKHLRDMSADAYLAELRFYSQLIKGRDIDLVALSEIENEQVAQELVQRLGVEWNVYFKQGRDTATGQDVALISRLPYVENSLTDFNFPAGQIPGDKKAKRLTKVVGAQFWLTTKAGKRDDAAKLCVITAHLLSKRNETAKKMTDREKQAIALRKAVEDYQATCKATVVLGDFNDQLNSSTLKLIKADTLSSHVDCQNFTNLGTESKEAKEAKRWLRHIDHILYSGIGCLLQQKEDTKPHSDHPAIWAQFNYY